ncbi:type II toxin-antitoxin system VapC family toxin [Pandoraea pnomenusa]|uniref:type II toxin-antitoxin system VapC family toxin n=1 Tax=Pandoraea pnomenusa TaxID=93220 RepID=UPI0003D21F46|nr:type II toxin-antitoxin system VapC family toxin [Pandoraea pnomenusa]AHB77259.1 twitching motility protein PilT [Pandoraea pnomenusa]
MSPKYMLDTNICIYLMKRQPLQVAQRFAQCFVGDIVISAITLAELEYGVACSGAAREQNREALTTFVEDVPVAPFDIRSAQSYGPIRLATRERNRDALDKLIAAHAVALGTVLVTNNTADFQAYPGLAVENWVNNH